MKCRFIHNMSSGCVSLCITSVIWGCYPQSLIIVRQRQHFTKHWYVTSRDEMHCMHGIPFRCLFFVFDLTFLKHKDCRNAISLFFRTGAIFWEIWWCKYCVFLSLSYKHTHTHCVHVTQDIALTYIHFLESLTVTITTPCLTIAFTITLKKA